jgi:hypothetical protein
MGMGNGVRVVCVGALLISITLADSPATAQGDEDEIPVPPGVGTAAPEVLEAVLGDEVEVLPDGLYRVKADVGPPLVTHGPDPKYGHGTSLGSGDPIRDPVCATDHYQHVLYGHLPGESDLNWSTRALIRRTMGRINAVLNEQALVAGGIGADYKVLCDPSGEIEVSSFTSPSSTFPGIVSAARAAGFDKANADYTIFFDHEAPSTCGVGTYIPDESLSVDNENNSGGGYGVTYRGCWRTDSPMHENGHNQGAVQYAAPYSTGTGAHCNDELDVMCYSPDGGDLNQGGTIVRCAASLHFDCANDTYFDPAPESDEYLATHWNVGSRLNRFIAYPAGSNAAPRPSFEFSCEELTCAFRDASNDPDGAIVGRVWAFGDVTDSRSESPAHTYEVPGTNPVSLTVTDTDAETTSVTKWVPAGTRHLVKGVPLQDLAGEPGTSIYYRVRVPRHRSNLRLVVDGPDCEGPDCGPGFDLFAARNRRPTPAAARCAAAIPGSDEACRVKRPKAGIWYAGIYNGDVAGGAPYVVKARYARRQGS